jgi:hypothetical protein
MYVPNHLFEEDCGDTLIVAPRRPMLADNSELSQTYDATCVNAVRFVEVTVLFAGHGKPFLIVLPVVSPPMWHQQKAAYTLGCPYWAVFLKSPSKAPETKYDNSAAAGH